MSSTRIYRIWKDMLTRCNNKNYRLYKDYGGRGITVVKEWSKFENFYRDMKTGYAENLSIDRINNNKGYSKINCKWSTRKEQNSNKRMHKLTTEKVLEIRKAYKYGEGVKLAKKYGVSRGVISEIVNKTRNYANII